jgi:hypothetical protein
MCNSACIHILPLLPPHFNFRPLHFVWKQSHVSGFASIKGKSSWFLLRSKRQATLHPLLENLSLPFLQNHPALGPSLHPIPSLGSLPPQPLLFKPHSLHHRPDSPFSCLVPTAFLLLSLVPRFISFLFSFVGLKFELRALCLQSRCSTI